VSKRADAIAIAESDMSAGGYRYGPFIDCRPLGSTESDFWAVEFANPGQTGRCKTSDPDSIVLRVNVRTKEVQPVDPM
jgi:hypothetical protein